ncbi:MAG: NAD(P)-dependent oxidoreductase [Nanoarchaeota archaeon]|nr:NAD(P)-dependent oxidoreductase [Nanoarchaeota archaeon]
MIRRVLISDNIDINAFMEGVEEGNSKLEVDVRSDISAEELKAIIKGYDGIIFRSRTKLDQELLNNSNLLCAVRAGNGLDNVHLETANKKGIQIFNCPELSKENVADYSIAMLVNLTRNLIKAHLSMLDGKWERDLLTGCSFKNKTLGILGLGRIGTEVAIRARAHGMKVIAQDTEKTEEYATKHGVTLVSLPELLRQSDFLTLHLPLNKETHRLLNREKISLLKKGVYIINSSREQLFDFTALAEAIESGHVAGYATDVFEEEPPHSEHELIKLAKRGYNILLTPHLGAQVMEVQQTIARDSGKKVVHFFDNLEQKDKSR